MPRVLIIIFLLFFVLDLLLFVFLFGHIRIWQRAAAAGLALTFQQLIGMKLRRVPPELIVDQALRLRNAGIVPVSVADLEAHYLAGGNLTNVVGGLIHAAQAGIELSFEQAAALDLEGMDVIQTLRAQEG